MSSVRASVLLAFENMLILHEISVGIFFYKNKRQFVIDKLNELMDSQFIIYFD